MIGLLATGFILGWCVAWPPGPINAEMIRRGLSSGFGPAFALGAGASTGDFCWAVAVSLGAGALIDVPGLRVGLGVVSCLMLFALAWLFLRSAFAAWRAHRDGTKAPERKALQSARGGFLLGMTLALSGPWNLAFWLGVIGQQQAGANATLAASLTIAAAVIAGAMAWVLVLCTAVRLGARFATPSWEIATSGGTGALMLWFGVRMAIRLASAA